MVPRGLERRTLRLLAARSNQLSYETPGICATLLNICCDTARLGGNKYYFKVGTERKHAMPLPDATRTSLLAHAV